MIPEAAVEAAWATFSMGRESMRAALEAAAPHMMEQVERELWDAKRMVAILLLKAGGTVTVKRNEMVAVSDGIEIQVMERPIAGDWVISTKEPTT